MKILFFSNGDFREGNGANSRFICYGKGLLGEGLDVEFCFFLPSEFNDNHVNKDIKGEHKGIKFQYLCKRSTRGRTIASRIGMIIVAWFSAIKVLKEEDSRATIVYFYAPDALVHGPIVLLSKLFGFKVVFEKTELHSLGKEYSTSIKTRISLLGYSLIEKLLPLLCDHLIIISRRLYWYFSQRMGNERLTRIPILYDPDRFVESEIVDRKWSKPMRMGYLGSFGRKDGVEGILKSFAKARQSFPELKLRLMGYKINSFDLNQALSEANLDINDPALEILGQVEFNQIPSLLMECDLLLVNRINSLYANYGFPTKLAEYLATGIPVISSRVSDLDKYLDHGVDIHLVEPEDSKELESAIVARYKNYQDFNRMGLNGQKRAENAFSYYQHTKRLSNLFLSIVKKGDNIKAEKSITSEVAVYNSTTEG